MVSAAPSQHEELREVPLTSTRQRILQASAEVGTRRMLLDATAALLYVCADHLEAGNVGHAGPGHGSPGQNCFELERKDTLTVDEINTAAKFVCRDCKDRENACLLFLEMNLVRYASFEYTHYIANIEPNPSVAVMLCPGPVATSGSVPPRLPTPQ